MNIIYCVLVFFIEIVTTTIRASPLLPLVWIILMRFIHVFSICCFTFIVLLQPGCSGSDFPGPNSGKIKTTYFDKRQVISGTVYGDASKEIVEVSDVTTRATPTYFYSNKFVFVDYPSEKPNNGHEFRAERSDGSSLFSVWNGTESAVADVTVTEDKSSSDIKYSLSVSPEEPAATVNINPVTNLAYWLWKSNINNPVNNSFSYYLGNIFLFLMSQFPLYNLPTQNTVTDKPSPELLHLLDDVSITVSDDKSGFTLTRKATGQTVYTGLFTNFPLQSPSGF
jgi:hypothetical protein